MTVSGSFKDVVVDVVDVVVVVVDVVDAVVVDVIVDEVSDGEDLCDVAGEGVQV